MMEFVLSGSLNGSLSGNLSGSLMGLARALPLGEHELFLYSLYSLYSQLRPLQNEFIKQNG
jgi:hypothetical protein